MDTKRKFPKGFLIKFQVRKEILQLLKSRLCEKEIEYKKFTSQESSFFKEANHIVIKRLIDSSARMIQGIIVENMFTYIIPSDFDDFFLYNTESTVVGRFNVRKRSSPTRIRGKSEHCIRIEKGGKILLWSNRLVIVEDAFSVHSFTWEKATS